MLEIYDVCLEFIIIIFYMGHFLFLLAYWMCAACRQQKKYRAKFDLYLSRWKSGKNIQAFHANGKIEESKKSNANAVKKKISKFQFIRFRQLFVMHGEKRGISIHPNAMWLHRAFLIKAMHIVEWPSLQSTQLPHTFFSILCNSHLIEKEKENVEILH